MALSIVAHASWLHECIEAQQPVEAREALRWQCGSADAQYRIDRHERLANQGRDGGACDYLSITAGHGSYIYATCAIDKCRIVKELQIGLWLKASRPDLQILARVVLPAAIDSETGNPLHVLVRGDSYKQVGSWQPLKVANFPQLLERQVRVLRAQHGPQVDARGAYVDSIAINVYGGQGETQIWLGNLEMTGAVRAEDVVQPAPRATPAPTESKPAQTIQLSGPILNVDGRPMFARAIEYQGEPLRFLAGLGFNAIRVSQAPSRDLLAEAEQSGIWIIAPPPELTLNSGSRGPPASIPPLFDRVLAWSIGQDLAARHFDDATAAARQVKAADHRRTRPLICAAETGLRTFSREVNILSAYRFPLSTSLQLTDYGNWLRGRPRLARPGTPFWSVIQTQPAASLRQQWSALMPGGAGGGIDPDALRLLVYTAIGADMRGLEFASHSPLDANDFETQQRRLALAVLNAELDLVEPWTAAGDYVASADSNDPAVKGALLQYERSRLLIVTRLAAHAQYLPQHATSDSVSFVIPGVPESHEFIELTAAGLRPLKHKRVTGGTLITLDDFDTTSLVLMTPDPLMVSVLSRRLASIASRTAAMQCELVNLGYAQCESVERRLPMEARDPNVAAGLLASARNRLNEAEKSLAAGDRRAAFIAALGANTPLGQLQRKHWQRAEASLRSTVASPFAATFATLPEHWQLLTILRRSGDQANQLPAGDFEDLQSMIKAGWRHVEHAQDGVETKVEVVPGGTSNGKSCLRMEVQPQDRSKAAVLLETAPLWVTTPPVGVSRGELVSIRGRIRVPAAIRGSVDGLLIIDSLGGEALAERFGETNGWEEFVLYRAAPADGQLVLTFALTGFGEAMIDDVAIRRLHAPAIEGVVGPDQSRRMSELFTPPRR